MQTLAVKYRPKKFEDVTSQSDTIAILKNQLKSGHIRNAYLFAGASGCGKALSLDTKIITNRGVIPIGELTLQDKITGIDGKGYDVEGIFDQEDREIYEILFGNGMIIKADGEHLWNVYLNNNLKIPTTCDTKMLHKLKDTIAGLSLRVPVCNKFQGSGVEFDYELYLMVIFYCRIEYSKKGALIVFTTISRSEPSFLKLAERLGISYEPTDLKRMGKRGNSYLITDMPEQVRMKIFEYYEAETVPDNFLMSSFQDRVNAVQFLQQFTYGKSPSYSSLCLRNYEIVKGLQTVFASVGYTTSVRKIGRTFLLSINLKASNPLTSTTLKIKEIVKTDKRCPMRCIKTNAPDQLYAIEGMIMTHNTTVARIFANELNNGQAMPVEMDAATHNGVDDVRMINEMSRLKNITGEYQVFIIDECHSISSQGWQAMLKLLEEPPAKTVFIFCTTEPHKIPPTILNRVQRYDFFRMSKEEIVNRLKFILDNENIKEYDVNAIEYIARMSGGGMRDAISFLDKVLLWGQGLTLDVTLKALSLSDYDTMFKFIENLHNSAILLQIVDEVNLSGKSLKNFIENLLLFTIDFIKLQLCMKFENTSLPITYKDYKYKQVGDLTNFMNELVKLNNQLKYESNPKMMIDTFCIGVCSERIDRAE